MAHTYEVEIKSLLITKEKADELRAALAEKDASIKTVGNEKQLNHYFNTPKDFSALVSALKGHVADDKIEALATTLKNAQKASVRTRDTNGRVILVAKISVGDDTSSNGVKRIEWEAHTPDLTIDALDKLLIGAGFSYQAKWSREREALEGAGMNISIDKNAGYGYLAEFEKITTDESQLDAIKQDLLAFMETVGVSELKQDRLERMFAHYNANWPEYYGTEKTFIIE